MKLFLCFRFKAFVSYRTRFFFVGILIIFIEEKIKSVKLKDKKLVSNFVYTWKSCLHLVDLTPGQSR